MKLLLRPHNLVIALACSALVIFVGARYVRGERKVTLGERWSGGLDGYVLVSASQILPSGHAFESGVKLSVAVDEGTVVYIACSEKGFTLSTGEIVGVTTFSELQGRQQNRLVSERGFGFYMPTETGWYLAWRENPQPNDPVDWAFKRQLLNRSGEQFGELLSDDTIIPL